MKILQIIHNFPRQGGAGAENYMLQICKELAKSHEVSVLTHGGDFFNGPYGKIWNRTGYPFPVYAYFRHPRDCDTPEKEYWKPDFDKEFLLLLDKLQPDIIHFQHCINLSISLVQAAVRSGYPVFFTLHDFWILCPKIVLLNHHGRACKSYSGTSRCRRCMTLSYHAPRIWMSGPDFYAIRRERMLRILNECSAILVPSRTLQKTMIEAGLDKSRIHSWLFGIDVALLGNRKNSSDPPGHPVRFGYNGMLSPQKGVDILLQSFSGLPSSLQQDAQLFVYGDCRFNPGMNRTVTRWKKQFSAPNIRFMGPYSPAELGAIHKSLDVSVCPSVWYENRPLSILESFAAGNPVIASRLGGMIELVEETGAGWVFEPADPEALSAVLRSVITRPEAILEARQSIPPVLSIAEEVRNLLRLYDSFRKTSDQA